MNGYKGDVNIESLKTQHQEALDSLNRIREEFKDDVELLNVYEPTALYLVEQLESELINIASQDYGLALKSNENKHLKVDFWVSLGGEEFKEGKGPIGQVGAFLTRLYNANKQAALLITDKLGKVIKASEIPSLSLADTAPGSLKLGLSRPKLKGPVEIKQITMFEDTSKDNWEQLKEAIGEAELPAQGMQLLIKAIASVQDEKILNELKATYGEKEVIRIIHYAKELAPSNRSPIEFVKFEGEGINIPSKSLKTDKDTRKKLSEHAKKLLPTAEYIEGTAYIGLADVTNRYLTARPLKYSGTSHEEIRCFFVKEVDPEDIRSFLHNHVEIKGLLVSDKNGKLLKLEIDAIGLLEKANEE